MNTSQANRLPLPEIVEKIGGKFSHKDSHSSLWYNSPLRGDSDPSFHITEVDHPRLGRIWVWKDFGDEGGKVIDLISKRYSTDVLGTLRILEGWGYDDHKTKLPPKPAPLLDLIEAVAAPTRAQHEQERKPEPEKKAEASSRFEDTGIEPLGNRALKGYLYGRGIDFWIAKPYVQEMHYTHNGKPFFALAFQNDLGDYELRNPYFKGVHGRKAITTLHQDKMREGGTVLIFEGFMDLLSALVWAGSKPNSPVIVLNSVEMKQEAVRVLRELRAGSVEAYPDNDEAGRKLIAYLRENLPDVYIEDKSDIYAEQGYRDFNELVEAEKKQRRRQALGR